MVLGKMLHQTGGMAHLLSLLRCGHHSILAQVVWLLSNLAYRLRRQVDLSIFIKPLIGMAPSCFFVFFLIMFYAWKGKA